MVLLSLHGSTNEVKPLLSEGIKVSQLGIEFVDIISCDTRGCKYYNSSHDVGVMIPPGAVLPSEGRIDIEFGVGMHGPFKLADGRSVRRVSPIVWLYIKQQNFGGFQKDVKISIPHFLHFSTEYAYTYLRFLKADHQPYVSDENGELEYQLKPADGTPVFDRATHGTLSTRHFCSMCLASSIFPDKYTKYCLIGGISRNISSTEGGRIIFIICYFLKSYIEVGLPTNTAACVHVYV